MAPATSVAEPSDERRQVRQGPSPAHPRVEAGVGAEHDHRCLVVRLELADRAGHEALLLRPVRLRYGVGAVDEEYDRGAVVALPGLGPGQRHNDTGRHQEPQRESQFLARGGHAVDVPVARDEPGCCR